MNTNTNHEKGFSKMSINWYPGHMVKAKKEIQDILKLIDVVIEIIDARIPIASQNPDMQEIIQHKQSLLVLNKSDLADEQQTNQWVQYFQKNNRSAIAMNANTGDGIHKVIKEIEKIAQQEKNNNLQKGRVGKPIRALIIGIPNVGKSSFINRISKKNSMKVGNKPGITKQKQWIRVSNQIELLDTPGVLWPKFQTDEIALHLAYTGTIKDEILPQVEIAYRLLKFLIENEFSKLIARYQLDAEKIQSILKQTEMENPIYEVMCLIARKRGCLASGGQIDHEKVAHVLVEDFRNGKIGRITIEKVGN